MSFANDVAGQVSYNRVTMTVRIEKYLQEFLDYLEIERGRTPQTVRNYHFYLSRFFKRARIVTPSEITLESVRKFRLHLNRDIAGRDDANLKKTTQNYHLIALRAFLKYLAKRDVDSLSAEKIELAKQETRSVSFLESDELAAMLALPAKDPSIVGMRDRAILEMLFSTGLRVSELANLHIDMVNLKNDEFTVKGKGGKHRIVFLSEAAKNGVKAYIAGRRDTSPYLFVRHDRAGGMVLASPLTSRSIQRLVDRYARSAGITKRVTPHTLRHTYATDLLRNGADIRSVQSLLGHASITTTQVYTHITDKELKRVYKKFHGKVEKE